MDPSLGRGLAVVAVLLVLRHFAARRLTAGDGQFIVFWFLPTLMVGFVLVGTGIQMLPTSPPAGVVVTVTGSVYLALLIGFLMRMSRSVSSMGPGDDLGAALAQPVGEYLTALMGLVLIGGFAGLVGLLVWAASQAAR
ncbi:MAG: hypothetical protein E6J17_00195 [Chloroflexi bacterium]|nr:MAG: hypothetical protein E6J17_00195 [Chloroflexota bacterium]